MSNKVLRFFNPGFKPSEWTAENPYLQRGEIGVEVNEVTGVAERFKIGPGNWNDLPYFDDPIYPFTDVVTNQIGDVLEGTTRNGEPMSVILRDMISPKLIPTPQNLANNANQDASFSAEVVRKIGESVDTSVTLQYSLDPLAEPNLLPSDNINVSSADGIFSNEGLFTHSTGQIVMNLTASLAPISTYKYLIEVFSKSIKGDSPIVTTSIAFKPEALWGSSPLTSLNPAEIATLANRITTDTYELDFRFTNAEYHYIALPVMLGAGNLIFTDVTDPNAPITTSMLNLGTFTVNNGTGTYDYVLYRSEYLLLNPKVIRIRDAQS